MVITHVMNICNYQINKLKSTSCHTTNLSSPVAEIKTTCGATIGDKIGTITSLAFQGMSHKH